MTQGRLIAVVGPSGVGKDSVMTALAQARPGIRLARRVITRPATAGGEAFDSVTFDDFATRAAAGEFVLHWRAHGLRYGIPRSVEVDLEAGHDVVANLSRAVLGTARARISRVVVIQLSAPAEVLAERLAARGRESAEDIAARLRRADFALPAGIAAWAVDNSGPLDQTVARLLALLDQDDSPRTGTRKDRAET
ncbi:phosphonate metabolism protein/1,5-bisphosphokinase (PRPP-forming) PhnN [Pseudooceanicola aestuarii]|uniref:phosphonate metabolism protein/1,5-bisphosphokinase (PRPP-forming) PhnN n=1 Tax=Pseudooceanicola aestuarii TaxID=2697319 RepID=UPI0013D25406|nr:phosphonate metabolism protein/1,5-bisphosphokinase (PRPP-forming) PhnN [Pseudooceanicola aestuarii]